MIFVTSATHHQSKSDLAMLQIDKKADIRKFGGAGWKFWNLILGDADLYVYCTGGMKLWDICAGEAILHEIGGKMTNPTGTPFTYNLDNITIKSGLIASRLGNNHKNYINSI